MLKSILSTIVLGTVLVGCQSTQATHKHEAAVASEQAVKCSKCDVTFVQVPETGGKGRVVGYRTQKSMECPDCRNAVQNFFETGKLTHACKSCGEDTMQLCQGH